MQEQDYKTIARSRLTDRHRGDEAFLAILDTAIELKESRQRELLGIAEDFFDIDKSNGSNLDLIGKLIGEERTLVNFIDREYFGFLGARLSEAYDIGYWYSLYRNKYGTLRTLSDEEYRRVLKARIIKNSSDNGRTSFLKVLNTLLGNEQAVVVEHENNTAIEVRIKDEDGLASYYLSKYKSDRNLIPVPLGRRIQVVQLSPIYYSSLLYPQYLVEDISTSLSVDGSTKRSDPALVSVKIDAVDSVGVGLSLQDSFIGKTTKADASDNVSTHLSVNDVISRQTLKYNAIENINVQLSLQSAISKPRIKTNVDENISTSLTIKDTIRETI